MPAIMAPRKESGEMTATDQLDNAKFSLARAGVIHRCTGVSSSIFFKLLQIASPSSKRRGTFSTVQASRVNRVNEETIPSDEFSQSTTATIRSAIFSTYQELARREAVQH
jgi:hypothetical protein